MGAGVDTGTVRSKLSNGAVVDGGGSNDVLIHIICMSCVESQCKALQKGAERNCVRVERDNVNILGNKSGSQLEEFVGGEGEIHW